MTDEQVLEQTLEEMEQLEKANRNVDITGCTNDCTHNGPHHE